MSITQPKTLFLATVTAMLILSGCVDSSGSSEQNEISDDSSTPGETGGTGGTGDGDGSDGDTGETGEIGDNDDSPDIEEITLNWEAPTTRTDGTCLDADLSGFKINYQSETSGVSKETGLAMNDGGLSCTQVDSDSACGAMVYSCSYTLVDLGSDTWNITVQAYDNNELFSLDSEPVTVTIN